MSTISIIMVPLIYAAREPYRIPEEAEAENSEN